MTSADIAAVMEKEPLLNDFGIGLFLNGRGRTKEQREAEFRENRAALLRSAEGCSLACEWLSRREKIKTTNRRHNSYGYKHMVERAAGKYITNGAFIAAAIHLGFPYRIDADSPNVCFGIAERSLKGESGV